eukprot:scaffold69_cov248-Pinguiococcus_pyrenoidosus.AAC.86
MLIWIWIPCLVCCRRHPKDHGRRNVATYDGADVAVGFRDRNSDASADGHQRAKEQLRLFANYQCGVRKTTAPRNAAQKALTKTPRTAISCVGQRRSSANGMNTIPKQNPAVRRLEHLRLRHQFGSQAYTGAKSSHRLPIEIVVQRASTSFRAPTVNKIGS